MIFSSPKIIVIIISFAFCFVGDARTRADLVPEDTLLIDLVTGRVVIEMYPTVAPEHVAVTPNSVYNLHVQAIDTPKIAFAPN